MKKRPLQDVVAPSSRPRRPFQSWQPPRRPLESGDSEDIMRPPRGNARFSLWIIAGVSIIILGFALSLLFSGARVSVFPKQQEVFIGGVFTAFQEALPGELSFEVMTLEQEGSQVIQATGTEKAEERASGIIIVFNDHSQSDQTLIKHTRFEAPDGRIYRIPDSIAVPGQKIVDGKTVPGSIEVTVFADEAGESYNAELMDFTVPGFKGSPQFEGFYARSKTPMTGGFSGTRLTVSEAEYAQTKEGISKKLRESLLARARSERPDGFYLFDDAAFLVFEDLPQEEDGDSIVVRVKGTLYGILFEEDNFAGFIAGKTIAGFDGEAVYLSGTDTLEVKVTEKETARPWEEESLPISISGTANIVWVFDEEALRNDLAGKSKDARPTILSGYPGIKSIKASIWPFWRGSFPEDREKIRIQEVRDSSR